MPTIETYRKQANLLPAGFAKETILLAGGYAGLKR